MEITASSERRRDGWRKRRGTGGEIELVTSKERVRRAIHFLSPDKIPAGGLDVFGLVSYAPGPSHWEPSAEEKDLEIGYDIWGGLHKKNKSTGKRYGQMAPLLKDWEELKGYRFPEKVPLSSDERAYWKKYEEIEGEDKYIIGSSAYGMWYWLVSLRGYENILMDMLSDPGKVRGLLGNVCGVYKKMVDEFKRRKCDAAWFNEDLGTSNGPIFSPDTFREVMKDIYKELYSYARSLGMEVFLYAAGNTLPLWGDFIEAGVDCLIFRENKLIGTEKAARFLRKRCCAYASTDIVYTNPSGERDKIEEEIRENIEYFHSSRGGYIAEVQFMFMKNEEDAGWAKLKTYELIGRAT